MLLEHGFIERFKGGTARTGGRLRWGALLVVLCTVLGYAHVVSFGFTNWDDQSLVVRNYRIRSLAPANVLRMFTPGGRTTFQPVRELTYALEYWLWGAWAPGYHLVNVLLHGAAAVLLFLWLSRFLSSRTPDSGSGAHAYNIALFTTLLFVVHPVNVESVAWVSSTKYGLLATFTFGCLYLYARCEDAADARRWRLCLGGALLLYIGAALSSPFAFFMPMILLLGDHCADPRAPLLSRDRRKRVGYVVFGLAFLVIAPTLFYVLVVAKTGAAGGGVAREGGFAPRMCMLLLHYARVLTCPTGLANSYPRLRLESIFEPRVRAGAALLAAAVVATVAVYRRGCRLPLFCLAWFGLWWGPVSNLIPISIERADRYMYMPAVGVFLALSAGLAHLSRPGAGVGWRVWFVRIGPWAKLAVLAVFVVMTVQRSRVWSNSITLWEDCIRNVGGTDLARANYGRALRDAGRYEESLEQARLALASNPNFTVAQVLLAELEARTGDSEQAADRAARASDLAPHSFRAAVNAGKYLHDAGRLDEAEAHFRKAIALESLRPEPHYGLGCVAQDRGDPGQALAHYAKTLECDPGWAPAHNNAGAVLLGKPGGVDQALAHFAEAARLDPANLEFRLNLSRALGRKGRLDEALAGLTAVVAAEPDHIDARVELAGVLLAMGRKQTAADEYKSVLEKSPDNLPVLNNLGLLMLELQRPAEAVAYLKRATGIAPGNPVVARNLGKAETALQNAPRP